MPGHTKTIYSRRQRMAPGQYETPLADFLDRLPDYINQFQQNQIAIGRQQLVDKKYEEDRAYRQRAEQRSIDQQNIENLKYVSEQKRQRAREKAAEYNRLQDREREENNNLFQFGISLANKGNYKMSSDFLKAAGKEDMAASVLQMGKSEEGMDSDLGEVRNAYYNESTSPYKVEDMINAYRDKYGDKIKIGDRRDNTLTNLMKLNLDKVIKYNKGFLPLSEWPTSGPDGQRDLDEYNRIKKSIDEDTKQLASATGPVLRTGMDVKSFVKGIDDKKDQLKILESKYATETRDQYNEKEAERQKLGDAAARGITLPNLGFGQKTLEFTPSSEESLADIDLENRTDEMLQNLTSDPDESDQGGTVLPRIIPQAQAGQGNINTEPARDDTLDIEKISTAPVGNFDVKDITLEKGTKSNPRVAQKYAGDIQKLNNLMLRLDTADQTANPDFTKGRLNKNIKSIAEKIKKEYGDFIDPNTGEFIDKSFSSDFFSVLSRSTNLSDSRLKQLFKSLSTAKPVQQAI